MTLTNNPPPVDTHAMHIDDLFDEAKNWLDGKGVHSEADAEGIAKLLDAIRAARKAADEQRVVEKRPYDDTIKAIQASWKPLLDKCEMASDVCKKALTPYQVAKEARQREEADAARREAEQRQREAREALQAAEPTNLTARADAERLLKEAGEADKRANRLDKAKPSIAGGDRAIGLRTSYRSEVTDMTAFSRWAWANRRAEYEAFLTDLAEREGRRGPVTIPGIVIHTERKAA